MTPKEAAAVIGCSVRQVRVLCQQGTLKSRRRSMPGGFYYVLDPSSVQAYADAPQRQGYPRGQKRTVWQRVHDETKQLCNYCGNEIYTKDGENVCEKCEMEIDMKHKKTLARRRQARKDKDEVMRSLGLKKVRGAMGRTYWE